MWMGFWKLCGSDFDQQRLWKFQQIPCCAGVSMCIQLGIIRVAEPPYRACLFPFISWDKPHAHRTWINGEYQSSQCKSMQVNANHHTSIYIAVSKWKINTPVAIFCFRLGSCRIHGVNSRAGELVRAAMSASEQAGWHWGLVPANDSPVRFFCQPLGPGLDSLRNSNSSNLSNLVSDSHY